MTNLLNDPLLSITRRLLRLFSAICFVGVGLLVFVSLLGLVFGVHTSPYAHQAPTDGVETALAYLRAVPTLALYGWLLLTLRNIVDTVATGSPFTTANADRLAKMGWMAAALEIISIAQAGSFHFGITGFLRIGSNSQGVGLLMIFLLFVLARIFRQGAAMREDLEGTV